jgi:hypothetical protein
MRNKIATTPKWKVPKNEESLCFDDAHGPDSIPDLGFYSSDSRRQEQEN